MTAPTSRVPQDSGRGVGGHGGEGGAQALEEAPGDAERPVGGDLHFGAIVNQHDAALRGTLLLDLFEVGIGAILGTHSSGEPTGVSVELQAGNGGRGVDVHADGADQFSKGRVGVQDGGDGGIEGESRCAKELEAVGLELVEHLLRKADVAQHARRIRLDVGEGHVKPGVVGDDVAPAQEFAIDAQGVHVAVHAGGGERIGSVDGRVFEMTAHLEEGGHDTHVGQQFAELLCLVEAGGRNGSGDAVVERDDQVAGREIAACKLLIIGSKLGGRRADE